MPAQVELRTSALFTQFVEVNCVAEEQPTPTEVRPELYLRFGGKCEVVALRACYAIAFVGVGVLYHRCIVVLLRFDIGGVHVREQLEQTHECVSHLLEKRCLLLR